MPSVRAASMLSQSLLMSRVGEGGGLLIGDGGCVGDGGWGGIVVGSEGPGGCSVDTGWAGGGMVVVSVGLGSECVPVSGVLVFLGLLN